MLGRQKERQVFPASDVLDVICVEPSLWARHHAKCLTSIIAGHPHSIRQERTGPERQVTYPRSDSQSVQNWDKLRARIPKPLLRTSVLVKLTLTISPLIYLAQNPVNKSVSLTPLSLLKSDVWYTYVFRQFKGS